MNVICHKLGLAIALIALLAGCTPRASGPALPAYWPTSGWRSAAPEEVGMDSEKLAQMVERIRQEKLSIDSLLIVRNGYLVSELYTYPYSAEQPHFTASTTKSVIGALVGIAMQRGYIKDVQEPLSGLLPTEGVANSDDAKKAITLADLLTMTSGLDTHENPTSGQASMQASDNWVRFVLDRPMAAQPGTRFNYSTDAAHLISGIVEQAAGMSARELANRELFGPLGIEAVPEARWPSDPQGVTVGGYGLALTPRDMAKFGYLFLKSGRWGDKAIVPAEWVAASTKTQAGKGDTKEYGYLWWVDPEGKWYAALGRAGQHIFVCPAQDLVVVFTADLPYTSDADLVPLQDLLDRYILPAVKSDSPLPANSESVARLQAEAASLAQPSRTSPSDLPAIAREVSGRTFEFADNPLGWATLAFDFESGANETTVTINGAQAAIGLDNVYCAMPGQDSPFPEGLRAHWENGDTLVVDDLLIGAMARNTYRLRFSPDSVQVIREEKYSGNRLELLGTLSPSRN